MMSKQTTAIIKGIGVGIAVGGAAAVASSKMMNRDSRKGFKKNAARLMKTVSGILDDAQTMMR